MGIQFKKNWPKFVLVIILIIMPLIIAYQAVMLWQYSKTLSAMHINARTAFIEQLTLAEEDAEALISELDNLRKTNDEDEDVEICTSHTRRVNLNFFTRLYQLNALGIDVYELSQELDQLDHFSIIGSPSYIPYERGYDRYVFITASQQEFFEVANEAHISLSRMLVDIGRDGLRYKDKNRIAAVIPLLHEIKDDLSHMVEFVEESKEKGLTSYFPPIVGEYLIAERFRHDQKQRIEAIRDSLE